MRTKLLTLSALLGASMLMTGAEVAQAQNFRRKALTEINPKKKAVLPFVMTGNNDANMYPCKVSYYERDYDSDAFVLTEVNWLKYFKPGLLSEKETQDVEYNEIVKNFYKYDEDDRLTEYLSGNKGSHEQDDISYFLRAELEYDDVAKDYITKLNVFRPQMNEEGDILSWNLTGCMKDSIVRDDQNRVSSLYGWTKDESMEEIALDFMSEQIYGDGIGPKRLNFYEYDEDGSKKLVTYVDSLEWIKCDNQVISMPTIQDILIGKYTEKYLLSKAYIAEYVNHEQFTGVNIKYDEKNRISVSEERITEPYYNSDGIYTSVYEYPDDNGTNILYGYVTNDLNSNGTFEDDEKELRDYYLTEYNDKKLETRESQYVHDSENDTWRTLDDYRYEYDYDDMDRVIEARCYDNCEGDMKLIEKYVLEYDDTATGIASVNRNSMDLKVNGSVVTFGSTDGRYMVSNADGKVVMAGSAADGWVSLEDLSAGLYIVKVNGCAVKVIR